MGSTRAPAWVLRSLAPSFLSTLSSQPLIPRGVQGIPMFLCWHHFPLDLPCSWFTLPQSLSLALASIQQGALELL
ncbi:hypothetical protein Golob_023512 [Gossypium lobatum]|nr:hypothetical protein [Gossypium lobatum]